MSMPEEKNIGTLEVRGLKGALGSGFYAARVAVHDEKYLAAQREGQLRRECGKVTVTGDGKQAGTLGQNHCVNIPCAVAKVNDIVRPFETDYTR